MMLPPTRPRRRPPPRPSGRAPSASRRGSTWCFAEGVKTGCALSSRRPVGRGVSRSHGGLDWGRARGACRYLMQFEKRRRSFSFWGDSFVISSKAGQKCEGSCRCVCVSRWWGAKTTSRGTKGSRRQASAVPPWSCSSADPSHLPKPTQPTERAPPTNHKLSSLCPRTHPPLPHCAAWYSILLIPSVTHRTHEKNARAPSAAAVVVARRLHLLAPSLSVSSVLRRCREGETHSAWCRCPLVGFFCRSSVCVCAPPPASAREQALQEVCLPCAAATHQDWRPPALPLTPSAIHERIACRRSAGAWRGNGRAALRNERPCEAPQKSARPPPLSPLSLLFSPAIHNRETHYRDPPPCQAGLALP
jgi:hypothetical protein